MDVNPMDEQALADEQERQRLAAETRSKLLADIAAAVATITDARDAAQGDVTTAQGLADQARAASATVATKRAQTAAWVPSPTYTPADLALIRDAIVDVLARQVAILDALAGIYGYRAAVDRNAVMTDNALLWVARFVADVLD